MTRSTISHIWLALLLCAVGQARGEDCKPPVVGDLQARNCEPDRRLDEFVRRPTPDLEPIQRRVADVEQHLATAAAFLAFSQTVASGDGVLPVRPEFPALLQTTDNVFDLSDDLGCVWWSGVTNTGKDGKTANQIFGTSTDGITNSDKINAAIAQGKSLGDRYGRYFPVAARSELQPYAIRIPASGARYGGTIQGTGFIKRGGIPSGHSNAGTSFVCTTDPNVVGYDKQGVIGYNGLGWTLGPFNIIGRYITPGMDAPDLVKNGRMARYGIHFLAAPAGNVAGAVSCFYLQEGITLERDSNNTWYQLQFTGVRDCYVSNNLQTVNNRIIKVTVDDWCGTVFKFNEGGTLKVDQLTWNKPATLLEIGAAPWGHNYYEFDYIWTDSQLFFTTSTNPKTRLTDLLGRPATFWRRTDNQNTGAIILRINGGVVPTSATNWFLNHRMLGQLRGYRNDVVVSLPGLPSDEAAAFTAKPSPQAYPADFALPDSAKGDEFTPPDADKVLAWWDMSQDAKVNGGTFVDGDAITGLATRFGENWTLTPTSPGPIITNDGLHHRRAANVPGSGRYLTKSADSALQNLTELEVHIVMAMADPTVSPVDSEIVTLWRENSNGRAWRIYMKRNDGDPTTKKVFAQISFDGTRNDMITLESPTALGWDTPALVTLRYNGTAGRLADLQPGEAELVVNGESFRRVRKAGPKAITGSSGTPLRVAAATSSNGGGMRGMKGRIAEIAVLNSLSTHTPGIDADTGSTQDIGELSRIRSYFRRKYGVW